MVLIVTKETFEGKFVISEPEVACVPITTDTSFLLLACDGFWDVVKDQDAVDFVRTRLELHRHKATDRKTLYEICIELTTLAYNNGSEDNISIVLLAFEHLPNQTNSEIR